MKIPEIEGIPVLHGGDIHVRIVRGTSIAGRYTMLATTSFPSRPVLVEENLPEDYQLAYDEDPVLLRQGAKLLESLAVTWRRLADSKEGLPPLTSEVATLQHRWTEIQTAGDWATYLRERCLRDDTYQPPPFPFLVELTAPHYKIHTLTGSLLSFVTVEDAERLLDCVPEHELETVPLKVYEVGLIVDALDEMIAVLLNRVRHATTDDEVIAVRAEIRRMIQGAMEP